MIRKINNFYSLLNIINKKKEIYQVIKCWNCKTFPTFLNYKDCINARLPSLNRNILNYINKI